MGNFPYDEEEVLTFGRWIASLYADGWTDEEISAKIHPLFSRPVVIVGGVVNHVRFASDESEEDESRGESRGQARESSGSW